MRLPGDDTRATDRQAGGMTLTLNADEMGATTATPDVPTTRPAPRDRRPNRSGLGRRVRKTVLVAHVLTSVGWFGVAMTVAFCGFLGATNENLAFYEVIEASLWLSVPLGLGAAVTGVILSLTTRWGLVRYWWVVIKEGITIAVIATDVLIIGPVMRESLDTATAGEIPEAVWGHCAVLAIATTLSVVKPRARTPLARRA